MTAKIYRPAKNAMQSGRAKSKYWILEFKQEQPRFNDPIMGWVGSVDTKQQLRMRFDSLQQAEDYALSQGLDYVVHQPQRRKIIIKAYADNFKAN